MLNSAVVMLHTFALFLLLFQINAPQINAPKSGEMLRGKVQITGTTDLPGFSSAEIAFAYGTNASDPGQNWFTLQTFSQPVTESLITVWDTTTITDGDYSLRLRVFLSDGSLQDIYVTNLQVRNDAPLPTETPVPTQFVPPTSTAFPSAQSIPTFSLLSFPSPTPFPQNPASLNSSEVFTIFTRSAMISFIIFILFSLILRFRKARS